MVVRCLRVHSVRHRVILRLRVLGLHELGLEEGLDHLELFLLHLPHLLDLLRVHLMDLVRLRWLRGHSLHGHAYHRLLRSLIDV